MDAAWKLLEVVGTVVQLAILGIGVVVFCTLLYHGLRGEVDASQFDDTDHDGFGAGF